MRARYLMPGDVSRRGGGALASAPPPIDYLAAIVGSILYVALVRQGHADKVAASG